MGQKPVAPEHRVLGVVFALHEAVLDEDAEARLEPVANHREQAEVHHEVAPEGELAPGGDVRAGRGREVERLGEDAPGPGRREVVQRGHDRERELLDGLGEGVGARGNVDQRHREVGGENTPGLLAYVLLSMVSLGLYSYW